MKRCCQIVFATLLLLCSCKKEESVFSLYYSGISDICPGTIINVSPTWQGERPTAFSITGVKLDSKAYTTDCFSVDPDNGKFSIRDSENLPFGKYLIDISCTSGARVWVFPEAIEIRIMKPVPEGIISDPPVAKVKLGDVLEPYPDPLFLTRIKTDGSNHVSIKKYLISSVRHNGKADAGLAAGFTLSDDGVLSILRGAVAFVPGVYEFDIRLTTYMAGMDAEDGLFQNAFTLELTSEPLALSYTPSLVNVETGYAAQSAVPVFVGSADELNFSLKAVHPSNSVGINVDPQTGVINFPVSSEAKPGDSFTVDIRVSNAFGTADFDAVCNFSVIAYVAPVTVLDYDDVEALISSAALSNKVKNVDGENVKFRFSKIPSELENLITINEDSGEVSCEKGTELPVGTYSLEVTAYNHKSSCKAVFTLNVLANPYKFTYVSWGNNMNLTPAEKYGNQWRISSEDGTLTIPVAESDIPSAVPVKYSMTIKTESSSQPMGATIDEASGTVTLTYQGEGTDFRSARVHFAIITVHVGGDAETAVTKTFPFFVSHRGFNKGYCIEYTPFVFRVNPKKGGSSVSPVITSTGGLSTEGFTLDYRRNIAFYRLGGPEEHKEGRAMDGEDTFLYGIWDRFYKAINTTINTNSCFPVSYYANKNYQKGLLDQTACYVLPEKLTLVVNPEKFRDEYGYADGVICGNMQYNIENNDPVQKGTECFPILLWLDPSYNEQ